MKALHPAILPSGHLVNGTVLIPNDRQARHVNFMLAAFKRGWDVKYVQDYRYLRPCWMTEFNGQHVEHREFHGDDYGPTQFNVYTFPVPASLREVWDWFDENGITYQQEQCYHPWSPCGQWYCRGYRLRVYEKRIQVGIPYAMNV